jgi:hypothetical protein
MKKTTNTKTKLTASIAIVLLMLSAFMLMATPLSAQEEDGHGDIPGAGEEGGSIRLPSGVTPDVELTAAAYLSFRPNPVGIDQTILVNVWTTPPLHVSRYQTDYTITITKPDGNTEVVTVDSYRADATAWFEYKVDQEGEYKLKFDFLGGYFPAGNYTVYGGAWIGPQVVTFDESTYYTPASTGEQTLIVQSDQVLSWPYGELPTDYWDRPVSPEHRAWWPILGYFPFTGVVGGGSDWPADTNIFTNPDYDFTPYIQAPNTAHVMWKREDTISGLIGGMAGQKSWTNAGTGPSIVYAGRCYGSITKVVDGEVTSVWQCYDIRTGEIYWERMLETGTPNFVMYEEGVGEVPGSDPLYGRNIWLCTISGGMLYRYNPSTGDLAQEIDISPLTSATLYANPNFLSVQNLGGGNYRLIEWNVQLIQRQFLGLGYEMSVLRNITWPWSNLGSSQDFEAGIAFQASNVSPQPAGIATQTHLYAADLETGVELWDKIVDVRMYSGSCVVADHGLGAILTIDGHYLAYDLETGNQAWTSERMDYPWAAPGFGAYDATSAYGMFFRQAYDGVYAFDWDDGHIVWHYEALTPFEYETPYVDKNGVGVYSFNGASFAIDGKLFTYNTEHTATQPITRGWAWHCIDIFTGEDIWTFAGSSGFGGPAFGDGYAAIPNSYDGSLYVFGKGKSATTVTAPNIEVPKGTSVLITGTVLDMSPAQPGTPCVSANSMTTQMEYLHMQRPIDGIKGDATITGVDVSLVAIGSDGSYEDLGTTTTDGYYGTFAFRWTPPDQITYEIVASFEGDDSYGSSSAATYVTVGPAPAADVTPEPTTEEPVTHPMFSTEALIVIGVIAIAAVAIIAYLIMRRPNK